MKPCWDLSYKISVLTINRHGASRKRDFSPENHTSSNYILHSRLCRIFFAEHYILVPIAPHIFTYNDGDHDGDQRLVDYQYIPKQMSTISCKFHAGYAHSVFNPILHWALNQNSLRQSSLVSRLSSVQRFLRVHFHERNHQPPPSSTNEAALGPFNPRYIKARPKRNEQAASSHLMY